MEFAALDVVSASLAGNGASSSSSSTSQQAARRYSRLHVFRTSQKAQEERPQKVAVVRLGKDDSSGGHQLPTVVVCPDSKVGKPWQGFGGSFTEASAKTLHKLPEEKQKEVIDAYFDQQSGLGYTMGRIHIGSCDFSSGNWTCGDIKAGQDLDGFSLSKYKDDIFPMLKAATQAAKASLKLMASPWSPVPWMKTVKKFNEGALRPDCRDVWAQHYVKFIQEMQNSGYEIWAISVQNEPESQQPWECCLWNAEAERDFVRDFLGPTLHRAGLAHVKILVWDHNRDGMLERAAAIYGDEKAAEYVWGIAYHWYGDARFEAWADAAFVPFQVPARKMHVNEVRSQACFENVRCVAELRPDKHIIFTEGCQELAGASMRGELDNWKYGERYAMNIIADVRAGCEGWIDWNLCLDEVGGPNHVGNYCLAPVIIDTRRHRVLRQPSYWFLFHFAHFVRPGARRVVCGASRDALEVIAFEGHDAVSACAYLTVVVLNQTQRDVDFWLKVMGCGAARLSSPAHSIVTCIVDPGQGSQAPQVTTWAPEAVTVAKAAAPAENKAALPKSLNSSSKNGEHPRPKGEQNGEFQPTQRTKGEESPAATGGLSPSAVGPNGARSWTVVGGGSSGGIIVRSAESMQSHALTMRLATGARLQEVVLRNNRLCFKKLSGDGPDSGWVSVKHQDRTLVELVEQSG